VADENDHIDVLLDEKSRRALTSNIWEYMTPVRVLQGGVYITKARCNAAGCDYVNPKTGKAVTNTKVVDHLRKHHGIDVKLGPKSQTLDGKRAFRFDRGLMIAMILNGWPISTSGMAGTRFWAKLLVDGYVPCSPRTMHDRHITVVYDHIVKTVESTARDGASFQMFVDGWSSDLNVASAQARCCIGACITFLSKSFERSVQALCVRELAGSHDATNICALLTKVIEEEYKIGFGSVCDIATDNASTEVKVVKDVQALKPEVHHTHCFAHTLNLAVRDAMEVRDVARLLQRHKNAVALCNSCAR